ncbi:DUF6088 family protein [Persicitalea sp.]|uniref:DUF6088 family protein n=1 Tax=Persicitalea sp. TaxID=3100273 RepID=UPI003592FCF8
MGNKEKLETRVLARISRRKSPIVLREDFSDLGGYDQVGRALRSIARKGKIIRIGYGLYAKAKQSALTGETVPVAPLPTLGKEALRRLRVETVPSKAESDYREGRSMQVPTGRMIGVKDRISRKISFKDAYISYEYNS